MLKRSSIVRSILVILVLGTLLPSAAVTASVGLPATWASLVSGILSDEAAPSPATPAPKLTCELKADALFAPKPLASSCASACRALYFSCLDDCDTAPFPGCANHCRFDVLYPCYGSCF